MVLVWIDLNNLLRIAASAEKSVAYFPDMLTLNIK